MRTAETVLPHPVDACWRAFTDATLLRAWVPGLRTVTVISTAARGLPREVLFEFAESRTYTLVYEYDLFAKEVRWEPQLGKRDAVRGFARFESADGGTRMTYALEEGDGRTDAERSLGDLDVLVASFARWLPAVAREPAMIGKR
ncbi:MAG TPA: SRPBCC family protein [Kofleriaceae bacterium]|nr:SRPBCC family protein [Kofleriaceae bacterium]